MTVWRKSSFCASGECVEAKAETGWRKASLSFSNSNCVEAVPSGAGWQKSQASSYNGGCVEVIPAGAEWQKSRASHNDGQCVEAVPAGADWKMSSATGIGATCVAAVPAGTSWQKAHQSYTSKHCVEAHAGGTEFKTAEASTYAGNCMEVSDGPTVLVRDSKDPDGPHLHFSPAEWEHMLTLTRAGIRVFRPRLTLRRKEGHWLLWTLRVPGDPDILWYTRAEVEAWEDGVRNGEFDLMTAAP